jgi:DNA (cytosine-5)-methyltransferase 1
MLRVLDLFSGIGGFSLGLERAGFQTVAFCEIEKYPRLILKKHWPNIPVFEDVRVLDGKQFRGAVELICGGFPCQPFSVAGKRRGKEDDRDLWPEMLRLIREIRPAFVICENVTGFIKMALDEVLSDLESEGYTCQSLVIPACAVGAVHRRDRVWIVARRSGLSEARMSNRKRKEPDANATNSNLSGRRQGNKTMERKASKQPDGVCVQPRQADTYTGDDRLQRGTEESIPGFTHIQGELVRRGETIAVTLNSSEPAILGVCDGFSGRVDRVKALGNSVVPQIPELIGRAILESLNTE